MKTIFRLEPAISEDRFILIRSLGGSDDWQEFYLYSKYSLEKAIEAATKWIAEYEYNVWQSERKMNPSLKYENRERFCLED